MNISYYYVPCTSGIAGDKGVDLGNCINPNVVVVKKADGTMVKKGSYSDIFGVA